MPAKRRTVAELRSAEQGSNEEFEAGLILRKVAERTAKTGNAFLVVELGDRGGSFSANVFGESPLSEFFRATAEGAVVLVTGRIEFYQGRFSPKLSQARVVAENELSALGGIEALVETAPESEESLRGKLAALIARIAHEPLRRTVELAIESVSESFFTAPAAVSMHHAYRGGLLEHTVHVGTAAAALLPLYPEVNADLALAGVLVHDVGKAIEYEGTLTSRKTRVGQLQGHVVLGYRVVRRAGMTAKLDADLLERLEHIILSHQGELEWGAAVMAATPEAVFVSLADNLDAKMGMVQRALRMGTADAEFSEFLPGLKSALLRTPPQMPAPTNSPAGAPAKIEPAPS